MKILKSFKNPKNLSLVTVLTAIILVLAILTGCSARKKISKTDTEVSPPPPPAQEQIPYKMDGDAYVVVEEMPVFPGGDAALLRYIAENTRYPKEAKDKNIQGRVIVRFKIMEDGSVSDAKILKGVDPILDSQALYVVSTIPDFIPGKQKGVPVPVWYMIPITFTLNSDPVIRQSRFEVKGSDTIYTFTSDMPKFQGGSEALTKFKSDNLNYLPELKNMGVEGFVIVSFIIDKNGALSYFKIEMGASPSLDAEALRVTKLMPPWIPGKEKGKTVMFKYSTPYQFLARPVQAVEYKEGDPYVVVEEMPMFPGGDSLLLDYISKNTKYPPTAKANNIQGRVIVRFCVTETGGIDRVSVLKGVSLELDEEAIRVVKSLPAFKPGKQGGKPVPVWYMVPITYTLGDKTADGKTAPPPPPPPPPAPSGYDEIPVFPGGEIALYKFINSKIVYPEAAKQNLISGKVTLRFCINPDGSIGDVIIIRGVENSLDTEAIRVVKLLPKWKPGKLEGSPVKVWYPLTVTFTLK